MLCLLRTIDELIGFEDDDLMSLIKNIEFCNGSNTFQQQLANKMKKIKCANKIFLFSVSPDKTPKLYKMEKEDYEKYLRDNITKTKDVKELS